MTHPRDPSRQRFGDWLDASEVAGPVHRTIAATMPKHLRGTFKRGDYIVGVPGAGTVAFDVKAKSVYRDALIFDLDEVKKLRTFTGSFT